MPSLTRSPDMSRVAAALAAQETAAARLAAAKTTAGNAASAARAAAADLAAIVARAAAGETVDPSAAHAAVAETERAAAFHAAVVGTLATQHDEAAAAVSAARVEGWRRVFDAGVAGRIAAAKVMDAARASLSSAEAAYADATNAIQAARQHGFDPLELGNNWQARYGVVVTEATESALWQGYGA